jgi:hypothetical protein
MTRLTPLFIVAAAFSAAACSPDAAPQPVGSAVEIESPAPPGSGEANLFAMQDGRVLMSWIEPAGTGAHALRFAVFGEGAWSETQTVAAGSGWFVNWADFPSVVELPDGTLAAHWLVRSGSGRYAYDVHLAQSTDGGATWTEPLTPHDDNTATEHGFVSLFGAAGGGLGAVWLDGRNFADADSNSAGGHDGGADMTLRYARVSIDGRLHDEAVLDDRTCECCQTAAALTADGPVVAYRDRSPEEVRDIYFTRRTADGWTQPQPLHNDGWTIHGCPVNGPFATARGRNAAIAWFTAAADTPRVQIAFSSDAGARFGPPIRVDDGYPAGRVAAILLDDGSALVSWLEQVEDGADIRVRRVRANGSFSDATTIAATGAERASGFPRMALGSDGLLLAWTQPGRPRTVRVAIARLDDSGTGPAAPR